MSGIMPHICRKLAEKAVESRKYNNLREALCIIFQQTKAGRTSAVLETKDVRLDNQTNKEAQANLIGYVAASLRTLGFNVAIVHTINCTENSLEVSWAA